MPGAFPGGNVPGPSGGSPPDPDQRPPLDGPPRQNVIVVMRSPDGAWTPVMVRNVLPDGRVEVVIMNRVGGKLTPGEARTVDAAQLRRALPQRDLSGT
jgi:hypothetical protein